LRNPLPPIPIVVCSTTDRIPGALRPASICGRQGRGKMINRRHSAVFGASIVVLASGLAATPASAQDTAPQDAAEPRGLEIVVTAQKREQQLVDVPISIAALGSEQLEANQISELRDFTGQVPNLFVNNF